MTIGCVPENVLKEVREGLESELRYRDDYVVSVVRLDTVDWGMAGPTFVPVAWGLKCVYVAVLEPGEVWRVYSAPRNPPGARYDPGQGRNTTR